jgi:hypothetical protein
MNSLQIREILKNDKYSKYYFKKVIAIDQLPQCCNKIKTSAYVINTDEHYKQGQHWVAIFYTKKRTCEFFDSFGMGPEFYGLDKFISKTSNSCITNNIALQSFISEYCGYYCILFILLRSRNISFNKFLNYFGVDSIENDLKIKNLINTFI